MRWCVAVAALCVSLVACPDERATVETDLRRVISEVCGAEWAIDSLTLDAVKPVPSNDAESRRENAPTPAWITVVTLRRGADVLSLTAPVHHSSSGGFDYTAVRRAAHQIAGLK